MNPQKAALRLRAAGMSDMDIAVAVKANPSTIWRVRMGKNCTYALGVKLIATANKLNGARK